jgi:hypothetical protein
MSRGLYAACQNGLVEGHSGGSLSVGEGLELSPPVSVWFVMEGNFSVGREIQGCLAGGRDCSGCYGLAAIPA